MCKHYCNTISQTLWKLQLKEKNVSINCLKTCPWNSKYESSLMPYYGHFLLWDAQELKCIVSIKYKSFIFWNFKKFNACELLCVSKRKMSIIRHQTRLIFCISRTCFKTISRHILFFWLQFSQGLTNRIVIIFTHFLKVWLLFRLIQFLGTPLIFFLKFRNMKDLYLMDAMHVSPCASQNEKCP